MPKRKPKKRSNGHEKVYTKVNIENSFKGVLERNDRAITLLENRWKPPVLNFIDWLKKDK